MTTAIAVVGPGSVGCYLAAQLAEAGHDVWACARRPFERYRIESATDPVDRPAQVATDPSRVPDGWVPRYVLLCVKAQQTPGAAPWLERLAPAGTTVVVVQNGTEGVERTAPFAPAAEVVPSVVYCGAELLGPGHVQHHGFGLLHTPDVESMRALAAECEGSGVTVKPNVDFVTELWRKLGSNVTANGVTTLTNRRLEVLGDETVHPVLRGLLQECYAVARAEGADLGDAQIDAFLDGVKGRRPAGGTSMLYDRRAGRATEHDAIYGALVRAGARHGIPTPLTAALQALIAAGDADTAGA